MNDECDIKLEIVMIMTTNLSEKPKRLITIFNVAECKNVPRRVLIMLR